MQDIFHDAAELEHIIRGRSVDNRYRRREVPMVPVALGSDGVPELGGSELAQSLGLISDCHSKDFGVLDQAAACNRRWRGDIAFGCVIEQLSAVVEEVEVLDHKFDNFRVIANIRSVGAILRCFQLNESSRSLLLPVSDYPVKRTTYRHTLNVPFFRAVSKNLD